MKATEKKEKPDAGKRKMSLRLWPGVVLAALQWLGGFALPALVPDSMIYGVFGSLLCGLLIVVWWLFFSRAARPERWGALVLMVAALIGTSFLLHESIATGNMGLMFTLYSVPVMCLAFVIWAVATSRLSTAIRRVTMAVTILLAAGFWIFLRTDGINGAGRPEFTWRWAMTSEERLMAQQGRESSVLPSAGAELTAEAVWPGFRGPGRDGVVSGVSIKTDWKTSPPVELWRRPVGPGCSSFAVQGDLLYTQEQRGDNELVSCYNLTTGEPVWMHEDKERFWDSHAGAGPRSTPTLYNGCVYTLGATGILNALNAADGSVIWSRNAATDTGAKALTWGYTGSPLATGDALVVSVSGKLAAYDIATGEPRWYGPDGGESYSSPHPATINGIQQVLLMSNSGLVSFDPASGEQIWNYPWAIEGRILQPAVIGEGELLLTGELKALRRVVVKQEPGGWTVQERWTSEEMLNNFNDIILHRGYTYGFDGPYLVCLSLEDGKRMWKGARYRGWLLLLPEQDLLLVLSEKGDLALVEAKPDRFTELAGFPAIKGKTWNHPVLAGNILVVRNAQEMAAFKL